jgi:hypothetical protein
MYVTPNVLTPAWMGCSTVAGHASPSVVMMEVALNGVSLESSSRHIMRAAGGRQVTTQCAP